VGSIPITWMFGCLHTKVMLTRPRSGYVTILTVTHNLLYIHIYSPELEDLRSVPFNIDTAYAAGGGTPHGRHVKISIFPLTIVSS
jgi:hypothetical protein